MITDHYLAVDEISDLFRVAAADAGWPVEWPNFRFDKPSDRATWARWGITYSDGGNRTLPGVLGRPRFGKSGIVTVEVFTPLGIALKDSYVAAQVAVKAYEGKRTASDVWFRDVRIVDSGQGRGNDAAWWSTTVVANFTYDNN